MRPNFYGSYFEVDYALDCRIVGRPEEQGDCGMLWYERRYRFSSTYRDQDWPFPQGQEVGAWSSIPGTTVQELAWQAHVKKCGQTTGPPGLPKFWDSPGVRMIDPGGFARQ